MGEILMLLISSAILIYALFLCTFLGQRIGVKIENAQGFNVNLEMLRGLASFSVFLAHTTMYFGYLSPRYILSTYTGSFGVNIFFMLTAYLFWNQVISNKIDFNRFYIKRFYRLVPIVITVVTAVTLVDFITSQDRALDLSRLNAILKNYMFGFGGVNDVFSSNMYLRINTIWTLKWEWLFYLTLPILAIWPKKLTLIIALILAVFTFSDITKVFSGDSDFVFFAAFFLGAITLYFESYLKNLFSGKLTLLFILSSLSLIVYLFSEGYKGIVHYKSILCTISAYFAFLSFLICPFKIPVRISHSLQLLGKVSYSFYLWHLSINFYGIFLIKKYLVKDESIFFSSPYHFFVFGISMITISLIISFVSFKCIEDYFLKKSHSLKIKF
ncbi:acyltransferase [Pantoea sp.]|uniref:acyltransferase family protein n=1 Tax=Pantoea sp. TaxID=69393 RepID=UPI0031E0A5F5